MGLPYAADAGITHGTWLNFCSARGAKPTHVLFNGGVLRAEPCTPEQILEVLNGWMQRAVKPLVSGDLITSVATRRRVLWVGASGEGSARPRRRSAELLHWN